MDPLCLAGGSTFSREVLINVCASVRIKKEFSAQISVGGADLQKLTGRARDGRNRFYISLTHAHTHTH